MVENKPSQQNKTVSSQINPSALLAAASFATDVVPNGCLYHSWRIALAAERVALELCPEQAGAIFFAGLMQEVGTVGASYHITCYKSLHEQTEDYIIKTHPSRGAALMDWLPGMSEPAKLIRDHHEWWDGRGYQDGLGGGDIPLGSQLLLLIETLDTAGCFESWPAMSEGLRRLAPLTGKMWSKELWASALSTLEDSAFFSRVITHDALQEMIAERLAKYPIPHELDNEAGVERMLHVFAALVDAKDPSTAGHSHRTAQYAKLLAQHMGLSKDEVALAYRAGLVHDCGRLGVPTMLLRRSGRLSAEEMELVHKHTQMTTRIMNCMPECAQMAEIGHIAGSDHKRYDGTGYPNRLSGENIPLLSRILSVVDAFDAMTAATSYKNRLSPRFAVIRLQQSAGTQFDSTVVQAMIDATEEQFIQLPQTAAA